MARVAFVGFGEVNTPFDVIERKCGEALELLRGVYPDIHSTPPVTDDPAYRDANRAVRELSGVDFDVLVVCIAGWIPSHAVIKVIDHFREKPMVLWGLCGYYKDGVLISTADQAGTTALRFTMQSMRYKFCYAYSIVGKPAPLEARLSTLPAPRGGCATAESAAWGAGICCSMALRPAM